MMKRLLIALALLASFPTRWSYAAFENTGTGARGTALGDNYASMGDDILSLMYNPAALARVQQKEITSEYSKLYTGLTDGSNLSQYYLGYGQPVQWGGTLSIGLKQFSLDSLYKERTLSIGYGEWLTSDIAIGGALKQLYHSFGAPNMIVDDNGNIQSGTPSFFAQNGSDKTAYSADLGMLYRWTDRHTLGISVQDVNEPNIALNPADHEIVPRTIRASLSYAAQRRLTLAAGLTSRESLANQTDTTWTGSAEKSWALAGGDEVAIRGSLASGSREFQQAAFGAGYRLSQLQIDYAFVFNLTGVTPGNTMGTHRFSLTYRFGPSHTKKARDAKKPEVRRKADVTVSVETDQEIPAVRTKELPRAAEITIIPEEIDGSNVPVNAADVSIDLIFDGDFDGVSDDLDLCPNTQAGAEVNSKGCASSQVDHHGNPLPRAVTVDFIRLEEIENGR